MGTTAATRVAILEDDRNMRESLAALLALSDLEVLFTAANVQAFWEALDPARLPDVALIDLFLESPDGSPPEDGCTVIRRLKVEHPGVKAIVLSGSKESGVVERCLQAGAWAFLDKLSAGIESVVAAVQAAAGGAALHGPDVRRAYPGSSS